MCIMVGLFGLLVYSLFYIQRLTHKMDLIKSEAIKEDNSKLVLGAYERAALLAERTKLQSLISRFNAPDLSASQLKMQMVASIKEEFDYNTSLQIYIKDEIWQALHKMKEQNIYIINQLASGMKDSSGTELCKALIELTTVNENATMNKVVLNAISYETKQLL